MRKFRTILIAAASFADAAHGASERPPTTLAASGRWEVEYRQATCRMARRFGSGETPLLFALERDPISSSAELTLVGSSDVVGKRAGRPVLETGGKTFDARVEATNVALADTPSQRAVRFHVDRSVIEQLALRTPVTIRLPGSSPIALDIGSAASVVRSFGRCEDQLLASWRIDRDALARIATRPKIARNPGIWFDDRSYPRQALAKREQGLLTLLLDIDHDGKIADCRVVASSQSVALDEGTCPIARAIAFTAAIDAAGRPTPSYYVLTVRWMLPG